jgi:Cof subfamily protein (haloacid dehalogenase superfamily)
MKIRALCTDIDGTLLDSQRELSSRTISALQKAAQHMPVILASSRMPAAMTHLQHQLNITDHPLICYNGGFAVHFLNGSPPMVFDSVTIPADVCSEILKLVTGTSIHASFYHANDWFAPALDRWTDREQRITKVNASIADGISVLKTWAAEKTGGHKIMCMGDEKEIDTMEHQLRENFSDKIHIYRSRPTYLELAPGSVSKATALKIILMKQYQIDLSEVIAFGDNYNDIDLLQAAGLGIAVANARDEVKAIAKEITLNSIDDGVAIAIEKYLAG